MALTGDVPRSARAAASHLAQVPGAACRSECRVRWGAGLAVQPLVSQTAHASEPLSNISVEVPGPNPPSELEYVGAHSEICVFSNSSRRS